MLLLEQVAFDNCKHRLRTIQVVLMFCNKSFSEFFWLKPVGAVHSYASGQSGSARVERIDMSWHLDSLVPAIALSAAKSLLKSFFIQAADRKSQITPASLRITHHFPDRKNVSGQSVSPITCKWTVVLHYCGIFLGRAWRFT